MILSISSFFIRRPVFATVCSLIITLLGTACIFLLPIAQYPEIAPTKVTVSSNYVGANAEVVESTVTNILERELNGIEGVRYITSTSANNGSSSIDLVFNLGKNKDIAAVDVQNRVSTVQSQLPGPVQQTGVTISKESTGFLFAIGVYSEKGEFDDLYLSNYADLYIVDAIKKVKGVGGVIIFGERKYAMRIWLDPSRLAARGLTSQDVVSAIQQQNLQVGVGQIGQQPNLPDQQYQLSISATGRLKDPDEFGDIVIKTATDGTLIKLKDVGRVELGAENYGSSLRFNGTRGIGLGVSQLPDANALDVAKAVKQALKELEPNFPPGLNYEIAFDTTSFIEAGTEEVILSLLIAIGLVILIIFIFLQNWRSTLIPAIAIPVSLVGTFIFIKLLNFNINTLTLFGLTLATGLVVDDAIVVVEDITRRIQEKGENPIQAAIHSMQELQGAVVASSLVLIAVFVPVAFFPGTTGQLYKQFALTIAFSITVSTFNALTLSPSLAGLLLKQEATPSNWAFDRINWVIDRIRQFYQWGVRQLTKFKGVVIILFMASLALTYWVYTIVPRGFLPPEDQGYFITIVQAPEGVSLNYTEKVLEQIEGIMRQKDDKGEPLYPEIANIFAVGGFSFSGNTPNNGIVFSTLKPWKERKRSADQIIGGFVPAPFGLLPQLISIKEAFVIPFPPPAIQGLSNFGGFEFQLQDKINQGFPAIEQTLGAFLGKASTYPDPSRPMLAGLRPNFNGNTPQLSVEVDRVKATALQVSLSDIYSTLQTLLGSQYINDFNAFGRTYRVYVQADARFRANPEDINRLYVRSQTGQMIPLSNLVNVKQTIGPSIITHYNLLRSVQITGNTAPGVSSGQAIEVMSKVAKETLPKTFGYEWSGLSLEEIESGGSAIFIFGLGVVFVFLVLAAQYENYIDPVIIMLTVPLAVLGALSAVFLRSFFNPSFANDIYTQIGLVMLVGIASKNAILIVEFANQLREKGLSITKAVTEAAQQRLRPILMTAFATIIGIFPLAIATGAGAAARQSLGTAVLGGMCVATFLSLFIVPVLYIVIKNIEERNFLKPHKVEEEPQ
ncbi:hydrophobe/amphiphile efflux-1 (HAE1) family transporter [Synechococcus sp. PCC 7502]|uniref:efflux RND transporter permease subunit n=1 Tax=Synechococcus sp. PCC 7502 TaxID=1173263 RepID=UPI00029FCC6D|nr:efflux RND transporter permease subunit [Synechococcus sp. PCC 7502]AFY73928.1 hydrophobe/amphiphile efflux-1 (HAE1) family transporter [Synechococcus sp. PCC 7502]